MRSVELALLSRPAALYNRRLQWRSRILSGLGLSFNVFGTAYYLRRSRRQSLVSILSFSALRRSHAYSPEVTCFYTFCQMSSIEFSSQYPGYPSSDLPILGELSGMWTIPGGEIVVSSRVSAATVKQFASWRSDEIASLSDHGVDCLMICSSDGQSAHTQVSHPGPPRRWL